MTERRTVYHCADGVRRSIVTDTLDPGKFVVHVEQEMDEILAGIERDRELHRPRGDIKHVARVPVEVFEMMVNQGWGPDDERKWLNSSDAAHLRIWRGRV